MLQPPPPTMLMPRRPLGKTGHASSVAVLGGVAIAWGPQERCDAIVRHAQEMGVNHVDVAPGYGESEERFGPWAERERGRWFVASKTTQRDAEGAWRELVRSLERLRTDHLDLWQMHAVSDRGKLDAICVPGGAAEAFLRARAEGLVRHLGITGHGYEAPELFREAIDRLPLETVMLPVGVAVYARDAYRAACGELLAECRRRGIGVLALKCLAREAWPSRAARTAATWYRPLTDPATIARAARFTLAQDVTALCTTGEPALLPDLLAACRDGAPMDADEQAAFRAEAAAFGPLFRDDGDLLHPAA